MSAFTAAWASVTDILTIGNRDLRPITIPTVITTGLRNSRGGNNKMTEPADSPLAPFVRFPNFRDLGDLNAFSIIVQDLSTIYDVTTVAVLPGYENVRMPSTRLGPRRRSPLSEQDRLLVKNVSLSSPLEIVFWVMSGSGVLGTMAMSFNRVAIAVKSWIDVLSAGVDLQRRRLELEHDRNLAPLQLHEAELRNALLEQQARSVIAPPQSRLVEEALKESRGGSSVRPVRRERVERYRKRAGAMTSREFSELLDEPVNRLLGYAGGEIELGGNQDTPLT
jgi:hypothetical protein